MSDSHVRDASVCLSFDLDAISFWVGMLGLSSPTYISRGEFAATVATPRILDLLDREGVKSTWFIPGMDADAYPDICKRIRDSGHEIGHHGYAHEVPTNLEEPAERRMIERGLEALDRVLGVTPTGYRSPAADLSPKTTELLVEYGFSYDSSLWGSDYGMYRCRAADVIDTENPVQFGRELDLVEIPLGTIIDFVLLEFVMTPGLLLPANTDIVALGQRWIDDLDFMTEHVPGGTLTGVWHPAAIGRASKLRTVENFIHRAKELDLPFKTMSEAADDWKADH
ncbi:polysaccharide deacetylase family protein [Kribbella sandramycini]|uniref:Peptidoglycan/xylan/chitin deacetylase (PgdA/CDA1 family) n=1 Tax=Kribbella sandramycini TaxID=60450 RepID=A0A7Y4NYX8_9ACTN|nr:polysaccharide deacetylase family protein [Kribbella sandramycini]MBB6567799.1 peptidoglycan/xylan/chitin deacetylase (PgdA/CDA1 family) [Kribbella sandramycini]NOL39605.1 polysaccharide deacetylase family protein [Kribbella sandramycini]